ncbi:MAG: hypothetical protein AAGK47_01495 [Bacteroidota bacterium]
MSNQHNTPDFEVVALTFLTSPKVLAIPVDKVRIFDANQEKNASLYTRVKVKRGTQGIGA